MEASHQIVILRPYFRNAGKRLVKTPKVYFLDTGTMCYLAGIRDGKAAREGQLAGALFETAVFGELYKSAVHHGEEPRFYFWRTATGDEVDFIYDRGNTLVPVEAKASYTPAPKMTHGIAALHKAYPQSVSTGFVVHPGNQTLPLGAETVAVPFGAL
jgi:predicted AAA+ superfamily ATPase